MRRHRLCTAAQIASLPLLYGLLAIPILVVAKGVSLIAGGVLNPVLGGLLLAVSPLCALGGTLAISIAAKWAVVGRYRPGDAPMWGSLFFRHWLVERVHALSGASLLQGSPLLVGYYRLMGMRIGTGCVLDTTHFAAFDLVTIGDGCTVGAGSHLLGSVAGPDAIRFGRVTLADRASVGLRSVVGLETCLAEDAALGDLSHLPDGRRIPKGSLAEGAPVRTVRSHGKWSQPARLSQPVCLSRAATIRTAAAQLVGLGLLLAVAMLTQLPGCLMVRGGLGVGPAATGLAIIAASVSGVGCWLLAGLLLRVVLLGRIPEGTHSLAGSVWIRKWLFDNWMNLTQIYLHSLFATIFTPMWLRSMGARIGRDAEVSTVTRFTPELTEIGDGAFLADGAMVGGRRFEPGQVRFDAVNIGSGTFIGNSAVVPPGTRFGDESLLGVLSTRGGRGERVANGTEWLGSPAFALPNRQPVTGFAAHELTNPGWSLRMQRVAFDAARVLLPQAMIVAGLTLLLVTTATIAERGSAVAAWLAAPVLLLAAVAAWAVGVVVLKMLAMRRFHPTVQPLWSRYVWRTEMINGVYETFAQSFFTPLLGTACWNGLLKALGATIGRRVWINTTLLSEFDLVDVGDQTVLNFGVTLQNHLFEDRIMKSSTVRLGRRCGVGNLSVVLYDSVMEDGSTLEPLSLLMKGERASRGQRRIGVPTSVVSEAPGPKPLVAADARRAGDEPPRNLNPDRKPDFDREPSFDREPDLSRRSS